MEGPSKSALARQNRLLRAILNGVPDSHVAEARLNGPPRKYHGKRSERWIYYTIRAPTRAIYLEAQWQTEIVSGLARDVSAARHLPPVAGQSIAVLESNGRTRYDSSSVITRPFKGPIAATPSTALRRLIRSGARAADLEVETIRFVRALGYLAPEVVVRTNNPRAFLRARNSRTDLIIRPVTIGDGQPLADGIYLEVRAAGGAWISSDGVAVRAGYAISGATNALSP